MKTLKELIPQLPCRVVLVPLFLCLILLITAACTILFIIGEGATADKLIDKTFAFFRS